MSRKYTTKLATILILVLFLTTISLGQAGASQILKYKMRGEQVKTLQQSLQDTGYNPGPVNGFFGYLTKRAVKRFQNDQGLEVTGVVTQQTWSALNGNNSSVPDKGEQNKAPEHNTKNSGKIILTYKDHGEQVKELQTRLKELSYKPGTINGYYAYMTKKAVEQFQRTNDLKVSGDVDEATWNLLKSKSGAVNVPEENSGNNARGNSAENNNDQTSNGSKVQRRHYRFSEGDLIKSEKDSAVYIIEDGKKRHITSSAVFHELGYEFADVKEMPNWVLSRIRTGDPITMQEVRDSNSDGQQPDNWQPAPGQTNNDQSNNNGQPDNNQNQRQDISGNQSPNTPQTGQLNADEKRMLNLVNQERTSRGLEPLEIDMRLVRLARKKSRDMIENNYFSHQSPTYGSPFAMLKSAGIRYRLAGENLATNSTVSGAHTALMNSPGHRRNLLKPGYTKIGIGVVSGARYGKMFTQLFLDEF